MIAAALTLLLIASVHQQPVSVDTVRDLAGRGDFAGARKAGEEFVRLFPRDGEAWYVLGYVRAALRDIPAAIEAYRRATQNNPRHIDAWNNLGDLLRRTGQVADARDALERGRRIAPKDPRLALNMALVLIQLRDFSSALRALDDVEEAAGANTVTHYLRARAHLETGDVKAAQSHLDRFQAGEPQDPEAFLGLAKLLMSREAYIQTAELLLALKPERQNASTQFTLGQVFYALDQMEKARDVFSQLTRRHSDNALYLTWKGHAERALGAKAEARVAYEKALRIDAAFPDALTELAMLELDEGRAEQGEALASRALALMPASSRAQFAAGLAWSRLQRWNDAVRVLQNIPASELEYPQAQYMLSRAYRQIGNTAKAEGAIEEFKRVSANAEAGAPVRIRVK